MSLDNWRYDDTKMSVRNQALNVLIAKFGHQLEDGLPKYSNQSIYECAQEWVSKGNMHTAGIVKYYEAYYAKSN
jgi:hypothetical protein|tara:strand:- start:80 stop:301 length:222 start_codon:yes stop_codon:yes gene_type:complete